MTAERDERLGKLVRLMKAMLETPETTAILDEALEATGNRRLTHATRENFPVVTDPARLENPRTGVLLDVETTGLEPGKDEVIQLAMLKIRFDEKGILDLGEMFDRFREPGVPISEEIRKITGITPEMVAGHSIDDAEIAAFLKDVDLVIAHNAGFDRKHCEAQFPGAGFEGIAWHCSQEQIDWKARGASSRALDYLTFKAGHVYAAHRADADILATAFALSRSDGEAATPFAEMLNNGMVGVSRLIAKGAPFEVKETLKARGYRWSDKGEEALGNRAWYRDVPNLHHLLEEEATFLRDRIYGKDVGIPALHSGPLDRYSVRDLPEGRFTFRTAEPRSLTDLANQDQPEIGSPGG